jgi:hypothetical protein
MGKNFYKKKALSGPMACAIHLRKTGLILGCIKKVPMSRKKFSNTGI